MRTRKINQLCVIKKAPTGRKIKFDTIPIVEVLAKQVQDTGLPDIDLIKRLEKLPAFSESSTWEERYYYVEAITSLMKLNVAFLEGLLNGLHSQIERRQA